MIHSECSWSEKCKIWRPETLLQCNSISSILNGRFDRNRSKQLILFNDQFKFGASGLSEAWARKMDHLIFPFALRLRMVNQWACYWTGGCTMGPMVDHLVHQWRRKSRPQTWSLHSSRKPQVKITQDEKNHKLKGEDCDEMRRCIYSWRGKVESLWRKNATVKMNLKFASGCGKIQLTTTIIIPHQSQEIILKTNYYQL